MPIELLIHNFGYFCTGLLSAALGIFVFLKDRKNKSYLLFCITALSFSLYCLFYVLSVNIPDSNTASIYAFLMIIAVTTPCFNAHLAFLAFNLEKKHKKGLIAVYSSLILLFIFFISDPIRLRLVSEPKGYFPNFFVPGTFYWLYFAFFFVVIIYFFSVLIKHYKFADTQEKNRLKYFFIAFGWGYLCSLPIYMFIFGIPFAEHIMVFTPLMGLYTIPLAYGVFKYDLLNINVAIKNTLLYTFFIVFVGGAIIVVNLFNEHLGTIYADFPIWLLPLFSAVLVLLVGLVVWNQLRQADLLKYEFINNISHKFRTPLTHVRWMVEEFRDMDNAEERNKLVNQIQFTNMRLFELTNVVINASQDNNVMMLYHFVDVDVTELINELGTLHKEIIENKNLKIHITVEEGLPKIKADKNRLQFALQIMFENSVIYTPNNGVVDVRASFVLDKNELRVAFADNGIGINKDDLPHVFSKFYRSQNARHADTEGLGIGLFMAKNIIEKHGGKIEAESEGENKGSKFSIILPIQ